MNTLKTKMYWLDEGMNILDYIDYWMGKGMTEEQAGDLWMYAHDKYEPEEAYEADKPYGGYEE